MACYDNPGSAIRSRILVRIGRGDAHIHLRILYVVCDAMSQRSPFQGAIDRMAALWLHVIHHAALSDDPKRREWAAREARDVAIRMVDEAHGYTVEFSHSPEAHREQYDAVEEQILTGELLP